MAILNPVHNVVAAREILSLLLRRRELLIEMTKRELTEKHAGQMLGAVWTFGHPIVLMSVYVFLYTIVFRGRIESHGLPLPTDYTVYILSGLVPWLMFQESISKGTSVVVGNANLVKQVVFPIEILPIKVVLASITTLTILLSLLFLYVLIRFQTFSWWFLLVPALVVTQAVAMSGVAFALSAIGCYIRDLRELTTIFGMVNIYLIPVVYLPDWVPKLVRPLLYANPFSYMVWCYQDALSGGAPQHPWAWLVFPVLSAVVFAVGYRTFRKLKPYLGNVL